MTPPETVRDASPPAGVGGAGPGSLAERSASDGRFRALLAELAREARAFRYQVAPNPCVGAALLDGEREVLRAYHQVWGGAHAEADALREARARGLRFDTLVVTLEPCSSHGKTPPCVDAVLESGVPRVIVGGLDPDPRHQGRGIQLLRDAGRDVWVLDGAAPLDDGSLHFLDWIAAARLTRGTPWTIAKWAQTRSGQLTPPAGVGDGRWISSPAARAEVHRWRAQVDAIVTGIGTVLADDPLLSVRGAEPPHAPPARVVLDSRLRMPPTARMLDAAAPGAFAGPVFVLTLAGADPDRRRALTERGASVCELPGAGSGGLDLAAVQRWLWSRCVRRTMIEAGPTLLGRWIDEGRVDQWLVYEGPIEGGRGPSLAAALASPALRDVHHRTLDGDVVIEAFTR